MMNIKLKYNFMETPRKSIIAKLSIRKLGSSSVLDLSLQIKSFAIINLRGVSTKLYFNVLHCSQADAFSLSVSL